MVSKKFSRLIAIRTISAIVTTVVLTQAFTQPGYHATTIFLSLLLIIQFTEIIRFVSKTNAETVAQNNPGCSDDFHEQIYQFPESWHG